MRSKTILTALAALSAGMANAATDVITLDLSKSTTELTFDSQNGAWTGTYDDDEDCIDSQVFSFMHYAMGAYQTWWGFTASNSVDNSRPSNSITYQFSNMGLGGIVLNDDGTVKTDSYGAPVTSGDMPYMVAFANSSFARHPADMLFVDDESYEVIGAYFNLTSYSYYSIEEVYAPARPFTNGDSFTLTIHGVAPDETEKTLEVKLASYTNGNLTINRGWTYVDLSSLGVVNELWFSMKSTDAGLYGDNTPSYFCMDKLMVKPASGAGVSRVNAEKGKIRYDRANRRVWLADETFAMVYDCNGRCVMSSSDTDNFSVDKLEPGVYVVKAGNAKLKIAR